MALRNWGRLPGGRTGKIFIGVKDALLPVSYTHLITDAVMTELAEGPAADGLVDINRASLAELMTLPGIVETRAQAVLDYRATHGPFQRIEDITNVSGIKEASYEKIKHLIKV